MNSDFGAKIIVDVQSRNGLPKNCIVPNSLPILRPPRPSTPPRGGPYSRLWSKRVEIRSRLLAYLVSEGQHYTEGSKNTGQIILENVRGRAIPIVSFDRKEIIEGRALAPALHSSGIIVCFLPPFCASLSGASAPIFGACDHHRKRR